MDSEQNQISTPKKILLVAITLFGFALANFSGPLIFLKMRYTNAMAILEGLLRLSGNIIIAVTISLIICAVLRGKKGDKFTKKQVVIASLLAFVALALAGLSFKASTGFKDFDKYIEETKSTTKQDIINKLSKAETAERRSKLSLLYARITYEEDGKIIEYSTPEGKTAAYLPTPDAEKNRDMLSFFKTYRKMYVPVNIAIGIIWMVSILVAGGIVANRRRSDTATPNQGTDRDRA